MATLQPQIFTYRSRNNKTDLTDVKGQVLLNGVPKFIGNNALVFTQVDKTTQPGLYTLTLTAAQLLAMGVTATGKNTIVIYVDSASASLPDQLVRDITVASTDDIDLKLGTPAATTISADIANLAAQQAALTSMVNALANATRTGGANIIQVQAQIPASGTSPVKIPLTLTNADGIPVAPTNIAVSAVNPGDQDRGAYIVGATSTGGAPYTFTPTPISTGIYSIPLAIPAGAPEEQIIVKVVYTYAGVTYTQFGVIELVEDIDAAGMAKASAVAAVQTTVNSILAKIVDSAAGLPAILAQATQANTFAQNGYTQGQQNLVAINQNGQKLSDIEGVGFQTNTHSLVALSAALASLTTFVQTNLVTGGKAV